MQQRKLSDSESIKVLEDSKNRVMAMGLIHQHLYQNSTLGKIDFKNYTKELVGILVRTNATCAIDVTCSIPDLKIELDNAIYFGLMINELAINSIKHAYADVKEPQLTIIIKEEESKTVLEVKDNGTAKDINFEKSNSFGWKMVNNISEKLGGTLKTDTSNGLCIKITFDKDLIHIV
jgi:two-component sensor histidine kinase